MKTGPLEFIVIGFEGNRFTGEILPQLREVQKKGIVRFVDLLFLKKDAQGEIEVLELSDLDSAEAQEYEDLSSSFSTLFTQDDIEFMAEQLEPNTSSAMILFEHTWAAGIAEAVRGANGVLIGGAMVNPDMLEFVLEEAKLPATVDVKSR